MNGSAVDFGRLARVYRALEFTAFGRDLERARFEYLGRLSACSDILMLGEGDGRCAERLAAAATGARILCVDSSRRMIERASRRLFGTPAAGRVTFQCADVRSYAPDPARFDAVVTHFFLDCFDPSGVASIVTRMDAALRRGAVWLFADFVLPEQGVSLLRARIWLKLLYSFFRIATGLQVSELPPSEEILGRAGWKRIARRDFQWGMVRSAVYVRSPAPGISDGFSR